ncbi:hypothetical protein LIER_06943 [Lithospermum erythrorhizon]|uniref:Uncharacterized protein n=1 Tax=Lithospermum erythrorhizon TaxID=34254 RepID=A0AAV3P7M9_LITER
MCPLYLDKEDASLYLFQQCPYTWEVSRLFQAPNASVDTKDFLEFFFGNMDRKDFCCWMIGMWESCHQRNIALNGETIERPQEVVKFVPNFLRRFDEAAEILSKYKSTHEEQESGSSAGGDSEALVAPRASRPQRAARAKVVQILSDSDDDDEDDYDEESDDFSEDDD